MLAGNFLERAVRHLLEGSIGIDDAALGQIVRRQFNSDLIAGEYFVQIRHYSRQSGTGKYSIKVRKL